MMPPGYWCRGFHTDADEVSGIDQIRVADLAETGQLRVLEWIAKVVGCNIPQRIARDNPVGDFITRQHLLPVGRRSACGGLRGRTFHRQGESLGVQTQNFTSGFRAREKFFMGLVNRLFRLKGRGRHDSGRRS